MHLSQTYFQEVIHLIDMDGAYIPDTAIKNNPDAEKPIYSLTEIQTAKPEQLALRNQHKRRKCGYPFRIVHIICPVILIMCFMES